MIASIRTLSRAGLLLLCVSSSSFAAEAINEPAQIARGRYLATAGNCFSCHTSDKSRPFGGGLSFKTDFGTVYSSNITPDRETGIGGWTEQEFTVAMRYGVAPNGRNLYPVFPYTSFTHIAESDMSDLYAYLKTLPTISYKPPANQLRFPFNFRILLKGWNTLFLKPGPLPADPKMSASWNRGAYLVQGLGHCAECHSERNFLGAKRVKWALQGGSLYDKTADGNERLWSTSDITNSDQGLKKWTVDDIVSYLKHGHSRYTAAFGPMSEVIANSTSKLTDYDLKSIAVYLKQAPMAQRRPRRSSDDTMRTGRVVYDLRCATCHLPDGRGDRTTAPPLVGSTIVQAHDPSTLINVVLWGAKAPKSPSRKHWTHMRAFDDDLDDDEVAAVATFVRQSWGNKAGEVTEKDVAKQR